jgi:hypothetical protein
MKLRDLAHARAGDKGDTSNISVIAYREADYPVLERLVTAERVKDLFSGLVTGDVVRYEMPGIGALNFVMYGALGGGVTRTLALDVHGKCLASAVLELELAIDDTAFDTPRESSG